ncbi:type II toxin-antitoxin system HipA family toxin [Pseudomonas indica]|uniref:type II toxin-antitoxin system HipA family toxin n=1 Tax=Pseudomonas indica TaxID=137658 RepID=UPI003FD25F99
MSTIGRLSVSTPQGPSGSVLLDRDDYLFRYADDARRDCAISLLMPVRTAEYRSRELHPVFQMNLPEGYLLEQLRNRLAKITPLDPMLLLALSGSSAPIGRLAVQSEQVDALLKRQERMGPGERLEDILAWDGTGNLFAELVDRYILRAGISGVQPKVLVPEAGSRDKATARTSDLIVKSGRDEFPGLAINEFLCMSMARQAGLPVPEFYLSRNLQMFVMRRFDRDDSGQPIGFEDMAALMGLPAAMKYSKSYELIAKAVRLFCFGESQARSLSELFDSVALSCIVGNGDAHLKNFGLLYSQPSARDARLAPAFDIVNTTAYLPDDALALELGGSKSLFASRLGILEFAVRCDVRYPQERIERLLLAVETVLRDQIALAEQVPQVTAAIRSSAERFAQTFTR